MDGEGACSRRMYSGARAWHEAGICQVAKGGIERRGASRIGWIDGERAQSECRPWASYVISPLHCACSYAGEIPAPKGAMAVANGLWFHYLKIPSIP